MRERYCSRCGRRLGPDEPLIDGMCPQCYLKYHGIFATRPVLRIVRCPKCGSWLYKGEWRPPLPLKDIIRMMLLAESHRLLYREVTLLDAEVLSEPRRINETQHEVRVKLDMLLAGKYPASIEEKIIIVFEKKICPRCLMLTSKTHKALVQVRSSRGSLWDDEKRMVSRLMSEPGIAEDIVEVEENKHGMDVKMLSSVSARRLSTLISRETGAKVTESFKQAHYRPDKGRWEGITTISVRIPDIEKGDLVEVDGEPGIVRSRDKKGYTIRLLQSGEEKRVSYEDYWKGRVEKPGYMVYEKEYEVIAEDKTMLYLMDTETGELEDYPRTSSLRDVKTGDHVSRVRIKDKVYMTKKYD